MASRSLDDLDPATRALAQRHLLTCADRGLTVLVYCTYRPPEEQARLFWQGRSREQVERRARRLERHGCDGLAEMLLAAGPQDGPKVTYAGPGESYHQYRLAYDCVPMVDGKPVWRTSGDAAQLWQTLGDAGQDAGLEWAGAWARFREFPHFQAAGAPPVHDLMRDTFGEVPSGEVRVAAASVRSESDLLREALANREAVVMVLASGAGASDADVSATHELARSVAANMGFGLWHAFWVRDPGGLDPDLYATLYPEGVLRQVVVLAQGTGLPREVAATFDVAELPGAPEVYFAFGRG